MGSFAKVLALEDRAPARTVSFQYEGINRSSRIWQDSLCLCVTGPSEELQAWKADKSQEFDSHTLPAAHAN